MPLRWWRGVVRKPRGTEIPNDYKSIWNAAANADAKDAIFTGATAESFESSGRADAERLIPLVQPNSRVLNIGCGIGRVEKYLAPHAGEIWGVDISGEMIRQARIRLSGYPNIFLKEVGPREFLASFARESFDLVFSFLVLQHMEKEDAILYLEDARRILRPGGHICLQFPNLLSDKYTSTMVAAAHLHPRSAGRTRAYTQEEVGHLLETLNLKTERLWLSGEPNEGAEIYAIATR